MSESTGRRKDSTVPFAGESLMRIRDAWKLNQEDFAKLLGVSREWVSRKEAKNIASMRRSVLRRLASLMGQTPEEAMSTLTKMLYRKMEPEAVRVLGEVPIPRMKRAAAAELLDNNVDRYSERNVPHDIPLFELSVAAGTWADVSEAGEVCDPRQIDHGVFRIRLAGDSMTPAYANGDVVEFRCLRDGVDHLEIGRDYYVQRDDGTATFKRLEKIDDETITLRAINKRKYKEPFVVDRRVIVRMAVAEWTMKRAGE